MRNPGPSRKDLRRKQTNYCRKSVWNHRAGPAFERAWPESAYELAGSSHTLRFTSGEIAPEALVRWIDRGE